MRQDDLAGLGERKWPSGRGLGRETRPALRLLGTAAPHSPALAAQLEILAGTSTASASGSLTLENHLRFSPFSVMGGCMEASRRIHLSTEDNTYIQLRFCNGRRQLSPVFMAGFLRSLGLAGAWWLLGEIRWVGSASPLPTPH